MKRLVGWIAGTATAVLLVVVAATAWLGGTTEGARWVLERNLPGEVEVRGVEGRLLGTLWLEGIRYRSPGGELEVEAARLELRWSPRRLLARTVRVDRLALEGVRVTERRSLREVLPEPPPVAEVAGAVGRVLGQGVRQVVPARIEVGELAVDGLRIALPELGRPMVIDSVRSRGEATERGIRIPELSARGPEFRLDASGRLDPDSVPVVDARLDGRVGLPAGPSGAEVLAVEAGVRLHGQPARLRLEASTVLPVTARLEGEVRDLEGEASWRIDLETEEILPARLGADLPVDRIRLSGRLAGAAGRVSGRLRAAGEGGPAGDLAAEADLALADDTLRIERLEVRHPTTGGRLEAAGELWRRDGAPEGRIEGRWAGLRWPLEGEAVATSPKGTFRADGTADSARVEADLRVVPAAGPAGPWRLTVSGDRREGRLEAELRGRGTVEGGGELTADLALSVAGDTAVVRRLVLRQGGTGARVAASGSVAPLGGGDPGVGLLIEWSGLRWPLAGEPEIASRRGRAQVAGLTGRLSFDLAAALAAAALPEASVSATGEISGEAVELASLRADVLGGMVTGRGRWRRSDGRETLTAELEAQGLDPGVAWPEWPGDLSFRLAGEAERGPGGEPDASVRLDRLSGTLRGRPVEGESRLAVSGAAWRLDTLRLSSGTASVAAAGRLEDGWTGGWAVEVDELADLAPGLSGRLEAVGRVEGPRDRPRASAGVEGRALSVGGVAVGRLQADARWAGAADGEGRLDAVARSVAAAGLTVDSIRVGAEGGRERHGADLRLVDGETRLRARVAGGALDDAWVGSLDSLVLGSPHVGEWSLGAPAPLTVSSSGFEVGRLCWGRGEASVCLEADGSPDGGVRWSGGGESLPLAFARPWLPSGSEALGEFRFETEGRTGPGAHPTGHLRIRADGAELRFPAGAEGEAAGRRVDSLRVDLAADSTGLWGALGLATSVGDRLVVEAEADPPRRGDRGLRGRIEATARDDGLAGRMVESLAATGGTLEADARLGGTLAAPTVEGRVELREAAADVVPAGLELREAAVRLTGGGSRVVDLTGSASSGGGSLAVEGQVTLPALVGRAAGDAGLDLRLRGDGFQLQDTRAVQLRVSPDLALRGDGRRVEVTGEVRIPDARISVGRIEAVVPASPDVEVVGRETPVQDVGGAVGSLGSVPVTADVEVSLGERVTVDAFGLRGRLTGRLTVSARPGRPPAGRGELQVVEGQYSALRTGLPLDRGRLVFAGSPLDDPGLDVRVRRRTADVEVGLDVGGTLRTPRITLFSNPAMSEPDLLSYLLFGRPVAAVSPSEGQILRDAARGLGLAGGDVLAARLGALLGLEDVSLVGEGEGGAALVLGARLSPRLDLGYTLGLFGVTNALRLSYRLGRGWVVRAESGEEGGADVMYIIER